MYLALAGGVGGAKLAQGLAMALPPGKLTVVVNTGDDNVFFGLHVAPDLDTVMYTLAGVSNETTGWGQRDESWVFMEAIERLGGPTWFRLGDRDLATKAERTRRLAAGASLSRVTRELCDAMGVRCHVVPMSDEAVPTLVHTDEGILSFHDYFVRRACRPVVRHLAYGTGGTARPSAPFSSVFQDPDLEGIILCPSNPLLSIAPILALEGVRDSIMASVVPIVAVSPLIGGRAVKGPADKIMEELGTPASSRGLLELYDGLIDGLIVDQQDLEEVAGMTAPLVWATDILMSDPASRRRVALETLGFIDRIRRK